MRYHWAAWGDINSFFGLMLDNVAVMVILFSIVSSSEAAKPENLAGEIKFTQEFVVTRMIPGTALGVLIGDLVYTWMAFRLARRTGRQHVTAMPLGLDTPSTFGVAFLVLLPVLGDAYKKEGFSTYHNHDLSMNFAWHVALTVLVMIGTFKTVCAPFGNLVRRLVPRAGLLGSLAAIALALIAFLPLLLDGIAAVPLVGMTALLIILYTLVAHRELPFKLPGALVAVVLGVAIYWGCHGLDALFHWSLVPKPSESATVQLWEPSKLLALYGSSGGWWASVLVEALKKLPIALPFALATIVGGIDCTESAAAAGDEYDTRTILLTEGVSSVIAGLFGGVIQTTPYIGHPAYKKMDGRALYTLATALFIGVAGFSGCFTVFFTILPTAAMFPILVFVGLEITAQSFQATTTKHYAALAFAMLPALAYLIKTQVDRVFPFEPPDYNPQTEKMLLMVQTLRCLAGGFIVTSLLWAAGLALILDGKLHRAALYFAIAGLFAFFGVIHSPLRSEQIGLPWDILSQIKESFKEPVRYQTPYHWTAAYAGVAALLVVLGFWRPQQEKEIPLADETATPESDTDASTILIDIPAETSQK
jgi:AGZA family xanthine/uracil permease-like MFS transporter